MGQVFLGRDTKLGRKVAIKFRLRDDAHFVQRFLIEARDGAVHAREHRDDLQGRRARGAFRRNVCDEDGARRNAPRRWAVARALIVGRDLEREAKP